MAGLIRFKNESAILPPQYFGSVDYYALCGAFERVCIDLSMPADKRMKSTHRCQIVDTRDNLTLTVPVSHPHGRHGWNETTVSTHGEWWNVHLTALESAYGKTPFFEFYIDRLKPFFESSRYGEDKENVASLDMDIDKTIRLMLDLDNESIEVKDTDQLTGWHDLRRFDFSIVKPVEYYQLRAGSLGFRPRLSILDLIFNIGPEAPLILRKMIDESSADIVRSLKAGATVR